MPPIIEFDAVDVRYGRQTALEHVTLTIDAGTSTALVGGNGSGKTTVLNVMAGLTKPQGGIVRRPPTGVAYVLQETAGRDWMPLTVGEVLRMARYRGALHRLTDDDRAAVDIAAGRLAVADLSRRQFGELSGGQRQRVLVAQALAQEPSLLLMDEPITGLDLPSQERILDIIDEETSNGATVVITTHHLEEAHHCDQAVVLATRLIAAGPPSQVLVPDVLREAYDSQMFGAHAGHDHPVGPLLIDEHGHHGRGS